MGIAALLLGFAEYGTFLFLIVPILLGMAIGALPGHPFVLRGR